jgi:hypothetical protein
MSIIEWVNRIGYKTRELLPEVDTSVKVASAFKVCDGVFSDAFHILASGTEQGTPQSRKTMEDAIPNELVVTMHDAIWILFEEFGSILGHREFIHILDFPNVFRCRQFMIQVLQECDWHGFRNHHLHGVYFVQNCGFYVNISETDYMLDENGEGMKGILCNALPTSMLSAASHIFQKYFDDLLIASVKSEEWKLIGFNLMDSTFIGDDLTLDGKPAFQIEANMDGEMIDSWEGFYTKN